MQARCGSGHPCGCWWISNLGATRGAWCSSHFPSPCLLGAGCAPLHREINPRTSRAGGCHARCPVGQVPPQEVPAANKSTQPWPCWLVFGGCTSRGGSMEGHGGVIPGVAHVHPGALPSKPGRVPSRSSFSEPHLDGFWVFHPTQVPPSVSYACLYTPGVSK